MGTFFGLNIARLGMHAQHKALEVAAHNIANANTPGFSRQVSQMVTNPPLSFPGGEGMLGSGVVVDEISRVRDEFLDLQIRQEKQTLGRWEVRQDVLNMVERIFMEPSETGFSTVMGRFFDSWQEVSLSPEASSVRAALVQNASSLVNSIKHTHEQLKIIRDDIDTQVELKIKEVNTLATQISDLNVQVVKLVAMDDTPADLMDRRDLLLDQLAGLIGFTSLQTESGSVNVFVGGRELVRESQSFNLTTLPGEEEGGWTGAAKVAWERDSQVVSINNGVIAGLRSTRDENLRSQMEDFETMAWGIINTVNKVHQGGMDLYGVEGVDFFLGDHLETLHVNPALVNDLGKIAAAVLPDPREPKPGDGRNALEIAQLRHAMIVVDLEDGSGTPLPLDQRIRLPVGGEEGTTTFESYYRDSIARLGVDAQESARMAENQGHLLELMQRRRDSYSGVAIDDEVAAMIQYQLVFQASARVITTLDEMFDTLINRMI